jgi:alpha-tubulin suppressor-like RCC1 family protein
VGDSTTTFRGNTPARVVGGRTFTELAAGVVHTCGIATGAVYCWGRDGGALGNGGRTFTAQRVPAPVLGALGISQHVAAGADHSCALNSAGEAYCWGVNAHGQLGDGTTTERLTAVQVINAPPFVAITAGQEHTCARRQNGNSYCWGWNANGRLGLGSFLAVDMKSPAPVVIP